MSDTDWIEAWQQLDASRRERLGQAIGRLLEEGLLLKGAAAAPDEDYRLLDRFEHAVRGYLQVTGWDLAIDRGLGVVQATNTRGRCRVHFNKDESILLCLLRLLFHERAGKATWEDRILVSVGELNEAYMTHAVNRKPLGKQTLAGALREFQRFKLVNLPRPFEPEPDSEIELLPTLGMVMPPSAIDRVAARLRGYVDGPVESKQADAADAGVHQNADDTDSINDEVSL